MERDVRYGYPKKWISLRIPNGIPLGVDEDGFKACIFSSVLNSTF